MTLVYRRMLGMTTAEMETGLSFIDVSGNSWPGNTVSCKSDVPLVLVGRLTPRGFCDWEMLNDDRLDSLWPLSYRLGNVVADRNS